MMMMERFDDQYLIDKYKALRRWDLSRYYIYILLYM